VYDSKVVGFSSLRELYLQFKAPLYSEARDRFKLTPTPHQHAVLKAYPPRTAYYVAPTLRSLAELNSAQRDLGSAVDFLRHFICIEVSALPSEVSFFHYTKPANHRRSPEIAFKTSRDGAVRTAEHFVNSDGWHRGSALLTKFKRGEVGAPNRPVICAGRDISNVGVLRPSWSFNRSFGLVLPLRLTGQP
jgi:hypothetical protein